MTLNPPPDSTPLDSRPVVFKPLRQDDPTSVALQVKRQSDGTIQVFFPHAHYPCPKDALKAAFPEAHQIEISHTEHLHPFSVDYATVDDQPYTLTTLTGGFIASDYLEIRPGQRKQ